MIAVGGQKGGTGKSTTALSIVVELMRRGRRVALVDVDPQGTATTWVDVAREAGAPVPTLRVMGEELLDDAALPALAREHDVTVIDCPAHLAPINRAVMMVADILILVTGPSAVEVWSLGATLEEVARARELHPELDVVSLLVRRRAGTVLGRQGRNVLEGANLPLLDAVLGDRMTFPQAIGEGQGPTTYDPTSEAAREVRILVSELERRWQ